jgi:hypothetical protein
MRFGLEKVDACDIHNWCSLNLQRYWREKNIPITYYCPTHTNLLQYYDLVFIDGDHETGVYIDYNTWKNKSKIQMFHDIQDYFCPAVVDCWNKAKQENKENYEYTMHPNNYKLMGIGLIVR